MAVLASKTIDGWVANLLANQPKPTPEQMAAWRRRDDIETRWRARRKVRHDRLYPECGNYDHECDW